MNAEGAETGKRQRNAEKYEKKGLKADLIFSLANPVSLPSSAFLCFSFLSAPSAFISTFRLAKQGQAKQSKALAKQHQRG